MAFCESQRCGEAIILSPMARKASTVRAVRKRDLDQQPVEAGGTVSACLECAYQPQGNTRLAQEAWSAFNGSWRNDLQIGSMATRIGGCRWIGRSELRYRKSFRAAELTLSFLMAQVEMRLMGEIHDSSLSLDLFTSTKVKTRMRSPQMYFETDRFLTVKAYDR